MDHPKPVKPPQRLDTASSPAGTTLAGILGVARAPFLPLAALLALDGGLAQRGGAADPLPLLLAVLGLVAAHGLVNVLNELADDASGLDARTQRTPFSGGSGSLQAGLISRRAAWVVAAACAGVALGVAAFALITGPGWQLLPVLAAGVLCILLYTPWLLQLALGELAAGLGLGGLPVLGAALLQGGPLQPAVLLIAIAATAMTFNLLLFNTIPDAEPDRQAGRRSLVHRLGVAGAVQLGLAAWSVATLALGLGVACEVLPTAAAWVALPALAFAWPAGRWLRAGAPLPVPLPVLALNVVHNLGTHAVLVLAWWLGR